MGYNYIFSNELLRMENVINDSGIMNNWILNVTVGSFVHLLIASKHDIQSMCEWYLLSAGKIVKNVILAQNLDSGVQRYHD